jgi:type I restriction enzyme M protein
VLFGTQRDDKEIRRYLLENCNLQAVVSMPGGVFEPYAGVKTSVLIFTKGKPTKEIWFYDIKGDGSSLSKAHKFGPQYRNDIPNLLKKWSNREKSEQSWKVPIKDIIENDYALSANAYNPNIGEEEKEHRPPSEILKDITALKREEKEAFDKIRNILK